MKLSIINIAIKKSLNLFLTVLFTETIQRGVIKAVNKINKIEIPSIPNLNFMKPLIQFISSRNWKSDILLSNEYHKNKVIKKLTKNTE